MAPRLLLPVLLLAACSDSGGPPDLGRSDLAADAAREQRRGEGGISPDRVLTSDRLEDRSGEAPRRDQPPPLTGPLRVVTFNVRCLLDDPSTRIKGVAAELTKLGPDAVALQEVCQTPGSGGADNFALRLCGELKATTGVEWEFRYAQASLAWSGQYEEGVAVVARKGEIQQSGEHALPQGSGPFPRKISWALVGTPRGRFFLYSTHLTTSAVWQDRVAQVQELLVLVNQQLAAGVPQIVAGDFNDKDWTGPILAMKAGPPAFVDAWASCHPGQPGYTIDSGNLTDRIDYIFGREGALKSPGRVEVVFDQKYGGAYLSDHLGVFAEFYPP